MKDYKLYTKEEVVEIVNLIMEQPDKVTDYLENENSKHDVESLVENALSNINK